ELDEVARPRRRWFAEYGQDFAAVEPARNDVPVAALLVVGEIVADVAPAGGLAPRHEVEPHVVGEQRTDAVPVVGVEEAGIALEVRRRCRWARGRQRRRLGVLERGAATMQGRLHRRNAQA